MTISNQGDVTKYGIGGTTDETAVGVVLMSPGATAALGTSGNPVVTSPAAAAPGAFSSTKQEDVASADGDYGSASLWVRRDTNTARTNADGDYTNPAVDSYGNNKTSITPTDLLNAGVTSFATTVAAGSLILKASAGNLYDFNVVSGASAGYLMVFNSATVPADGAVTPALCVPIAANAGLAYTFTIPRRMSAGGVLVFSTTGPFTKTISATAFLAGGMM